jgi:hypothetical protein
MSPIVRACLAKEFTFATKQEAWAEIERRVKDGRWLRGSHSVYRCPAYQHVHIMRARRKEPS